MRCPYHPHRALVATQALAVADGDPFLGLTVGERFVVLDRLGAGSMGTVYRARQEAMGRDVALKIVRSERLVDAQAKGRFQQEAHATSMLTSPHTVTVFDFGEIRAPGDDPQMIDGSLFLAMELLEGESLGQRLKRGAVPVVEAVTIVRQTLSSLAEAHEKGVVHRDLKPDNLLLTTSPSGELVTKVLDFGIAKLLTQQGGIDALETQAGTVFGTPRYMSPEQAQGKALDARSDIYSLGVILYHMLLGRPPFTDSDAVVVMANHIKTVPTRPSETDARLALPPGLEDLLMRLLAKDPGRRPQSARAFIAELDRLGPMDVVQASSELAAVVQASQPPARSRAVMIAGAVVAALVGIVAAAALTGGEGRGAVVSEGVAAAAAGTALRTLADRPQAPPSGVVELDADVPAPASASAPPPGPSTRPPLPTDRPAARPVPRPTSRGYERFD